MADIRPFRALRYADHISTDEVVTPPYDVINANQQKAYYEQSKYNFIRIDLGYKNEKDSQTNNRYTRSRQTLMDWIAEGVLEIDSEPALYFHQQNFKNEAGEMMTRKGFFSTIRLAEYEEGVVLPHERTLKGPKIDRLDLMKETECHLSPVFFLYDDPDHIVDLALETDAPPIIQVKTQDGISHLLWKITDKNAIKKTQDFIAKDAVLIADGHHRYETALAYRQHRRDCAIEPNPDAAYEFALGFFVNFRDPGLAVFGTHRVVHSLQNFDYEGLFQKLEKSPDFTIETLDGESSDTIREELAGAGEKHPCFVMLAPSQKAKLVRFVGSTHSLLFDDDTPNEVRELDVAILHEGIFDRILGLTKTVQEAKTNLKYIKGFNAAFDMRHNEENQLIVLMNATKVDQVNIVCRSGGKMPQKSTFFYPKVLSGLLINPA